MSMYSRIMTVARSGVVTAADFVPFEDQRSIALMDEEDIPEHCKKELICEFIVRRFVFEKNMVNIHYFVKEKWGSETYISYWISADELAIRMDAATEAFASVG